MIVALLIGGAGSGGPAPTPSAGAVLPTLSVSAPADSSAPTIGTCARVVGALPLRLIGLDLRLTTSNPPSPSIVAWGDPAIVLRCGVARPAQLVPGSSAETLAVNGVTFLVDTSGSGATRYTVTDRAIYLDVDVPSKYASSPLPAIAKAVATVLPTAVCTTDPKVVDLSKLCTRRK